MFSLTIICFFSDISPLSRYRFLTYITFSLYFSILVKQVCWSIPSVTEENLFYFVQQCHLTTLNTTRVLLVLNLVLVIIITLSNNIAIFYMYTITLDSLLCKMRKLPVLQLTFLLPTFSILLLILDIPDFYSVKFYNILNLLSFMLSCLFFKLRYNWYITFRCTTWYSIHKYCEIIINLVKNCHLMCL